MMHPADNGVVVLCGPWETCNAHIAEHGLDPHRVIKPMGDIYGMPLTVEQVIILDGWEPTADEIAWFWTSVASKMWTSADSAALITRAHNVAGLVPEEQ